MIAKRPYTKRTMLVTRTEGTPSMDLPDPRVSFDPEQQPQNNHRQAFTDLSPERFVQFVERAQDVIRRINRTPSLQRPVEYVVDHYDDDNRPAQMTVWHETRHAPIAIFSKAILRVNKGWFLMELKRDVTTTEFFRGYPL